MKQGTVVIIQKSVTVVLVLVAYEDSKIEFWLVMYSHW